MPKTKLRSLINISFTEKFREKHDQLKQTFPPENWKKTVENSYVRFNLLIGFFPGLDNHLAKYSSPVKTSRSFTYLYLAEVTQAPKFQRKKEAMKIGSGEDIICLFKDTKCQLLLNLQSFMRPRLWLFFILEGLEVHLLPVFSVHNTFLFILLRMFLGKIVLKQFLKCIFKFFWLIIPLKHSEIMFFCKPYLV